MKKYQTLLTCNLICFSMLLSCQTQINSSKEEKLIVKDIDGKFYKTVKIGKQVWMVTNLRVKTLNDGTAIPEVPDPAEWAESKKPAYCWYNNDAVKYGSIYGPLYNGYTVHTGKLAPNGWRIPTTQDWEALLTYLGGNAIATKN